MNHFCFVIFLEFIPDYDNENEKYVNINETALKFFDQENNHSV